MDGKIKKQTDDGFELLVTDNNGAEHKIGVSHTGRIDGHLCDAYADKARHRTPDENEYNEQARRYAKYYVYKERGYDTVEHTENPEYVNAVREAIHDLSDAEFEQYFGPLHQQLRSHHTSAQRLVDIPAGAQAEDGIVYEQDVYLGIDLEDSGISDTAEAIAASQGLDFEAATSASVTDVSERDLDAWESVGEQLLEALDPADVPLSIAAVSGIHVGYPNAAGEHEVQQAKDPLDRPADARIELLPADPGSLAEFREYLDHHLRCQVRDCFAGMGLLPPEPFQTVGFGKFIYARRYDHYDLYPRFHMSDNEENTLFG